MNIRLACVCAHVGAGLLVLAVIVAGTVSMKCCLEGARAHHKAAASAELAEEAKESCCT